jgi:hypothetical protein
LYVVLQLFTFAWKQSAQYPEAVLLILPQPKQFPAMNG